eukprot:COSAG01_NODE_2348_length_7857_cov_4.460299_8_plen_121_part_00
MAPVHNRDDGHAISTVRDTLRAWRARQDIHDRWLPACVRSNIFAWLASVAFALRRTAGLGGVLNTAVSVARCTQVSCDCSASDSWISNLMTAQQWCGVCSVPALQHVVAEVVWIPLHGHF